MGVSKKIIKGKLFMGEQIDFFLNYVMIIVVLVSNSEGQFMIKDV